MFPGQRQLCPASHHCHVPACWFFMVSSTGWEPSLPSKGCALTLMVGLILFPASFPPLCLFAIPARTPMLSRVVISVCEDPLRRKLPPPPRHFLFHFSFSGRHAHPAVLGGYSPPCAWGFPAVCGVPRGLGDQTPQATCKANALSPVLSLHPLTSSSKRHFSLRHRLDLRATSLKVRCY